MSDSQYPLANRPAQKLMKSAARQLGVAASLNADRERQRLLELLAKHADDFIRGLSRWFPIDEDLLERYEDRWDWCALSCNRGLPWSAELIVRYEDRWDWGGGGRGGHKGFP